MEVFLVLCIANLFNSDAADGQRRQSTTATDAALPRGSFTQLYDAGMIADASERLAATIKRFEDAGLPDNNWQVRWALSWKRELEIVSAYTEQDRAAFFANRAKIAEIYDACKRGESPGGFVEKMKSAVGAIPQSIDDECPTRFDCVEASGFLCYSNHQYEAAFRFFSDLLRLRSKLVGTDNWMYASDCEQAGVCALKAKRIDEAEKLLIECYELCCGLWGADADRSLVALSHLAALDAKRGRYEAAIAKNKSILEKCKHKGGRADRFIASCELALAKALLFTDERGNADAIFTSALEHMGPSDPKWHPGRLRLMAEYADECEKAGLPEKAAQVRAEATRIATDRAAERAGN
jgi:tetratricopeptide (TPR) repeat protein